MRITNKTTIYNFDCQCFTTYLNNVLMFAYSRGRYATEKRLLHTSNFWFFKAGITRITSYDLLILL